MSSYRRVGSGLTWSQNMEGNLNKARTSLLISPKGSPTFGEHKQVGVLYRTISEGADRRLAQRPNLKKSRPIFSGTKGGSPLHSRNFSENSLPSKSVRHTKSSEVRSASAMEYGYGGKSIDSVLVERSNGYGNGYSPVSTRSPSSPLTVLKEEGGSPSTNITSPDGSRAHGLGISNHKSHTRNTSNDSGIGLTRSQSQISTRELRDQMNGLRNKIADLGKAQQADKVRRSSLQNIQATSPVIAAEEWYAGAAEYKEGESPLSTNAGMGWRYQNEQESISSTSPISPRSLKSPHPPESPRSPISPRSPSFAEEGGREDHQEGLIPATHVGQDLHSYSNSPNPPPTSKPADGDQDDQDTYIQESHYEDAFDGRSDEVEDTIATSEEEQIFLNEVLEESLQDAEPEIPPIPDIVQSIRPERHEDRADAFDYENFFLHSALGNYSQNGFHRRNISQATVDSRKSYESNESVETTRGPQAEGDGATYEEEAEEDNDVRDRTGDGTFLEDEPPNHAPPPRPPFLQHFRTHSIDSVSSAASFATATEGGNDSGDSDTVPSEILLWGENSLPNTMVGAWPSPPAIMPRSQSSLRNGHTSPLGETNVMQAEELMLRPAGGGALPTPPTSSPLQQDELPPEGEEEEEEDGSEYSEEGIPPHPQQRQPPPNTEILISALITLANPHFKSPGPFDDVDKDLVVNVLRSVGAVCEGINSNGYLKGEVYETKVLRRRLDTARRILSGEIEVEDE